MKVLVISQHFYPEQFKANDIVRELVERGHDVTVLTNIPDYPAGKFYDGYGIFRRRKEKVFGATVYRAFQLPRGKAGALRLAFNYLSSAITTSVWAACLSLRHRYDAIFVHETSPVTIGVPAIIAKKIRRTPVYFWVLDLWPESLQYAGNIHNQTVLGIFSRITRWIYRNSKKILISSHGFEKSILEKGDFKEKIVYFPNWADKALEEKTAYQLPALPEGFIAMFAGNIGEAQNFETLMEAARLLKDHKDIHFVIVGDGRKRPWVEAFVQQHSLQDTVHCVGRHPLESMPLFFERADVMLVSLHDTTIFRLTLPAKFQAYMNSGKPILAVVNGEGQSVIEEAQCGLHSPAENPEMLAKRLIQLSQTDKATLRTWGENGQRYCQQNFNLNKQMELLIKLMSNHS